MWSYLSTYFICLRFINRSATMACRRSARIAKHKLLDSAKSCDTIEALSLQSSARERKQFMATRVVRVKKTLVPGVSNYKQLTSSARKRSKRKAPDAGITIGDCSSLSIDPPLSLCKLSLMRATKHLQNNDKLLKPYITKFGPADSLASRKQESSFCALARAIVYQQLAGKAAATIHGRLLGLCDDELSPKWVELQPIDVLRSAGLSERKVAYLKDLAGHFNSKTLSDSKISAMGDAELFSNLIAVHGIGPWTTQMYMMFTLGRPDILPTGDLGVRKGMMKLYGLPKLPTPSQMESLAAKWAPFRSVVSVFRMPLFDMRRCVKYWKGMHLFHVSDSRSYTIRTLVTLVFRGVQLP
eukprot:m.1144562 g.1144562  ORF g.1144562 m.1144562 type:complete len:355 (+) comp24463_c0_seq7:2650-3714(+)